MSRDSSATHLHMHTAHHADLLESFTNPLSSTLPAEEIPIPPHLQPLNPEDEDDVVPDQHAAFGIVRANAAAMGRREASWRDLGLEELVRRAPGERMGDAGQPGGGGTGTRGGGGVGGAGGAQGGEGMRGFVVLPRRDEPVRLALGRRPGAGAGTGRMGGGGEGQVGGGAAGNGLPR